MRIADESLSFVEHLRTEHRHLQAAVQAINESLEQDANVTLELVQRLAALCEEMAHHFREEEEGGCVDEAVSRCPSLSPEAREVSEQHPQLLEAANSILAIARKQATAGAEASEIRRIFSDFAHRLLEHEEAENRIMQVAFGCQCAGEAGLEDPSQTHTAGKRED